MVRESFWWIAGAAIIGVIASRQIVKGAIVQNTSNQNVQAFLAMIRQFESNGDYAVLYGGGHFGSFDSHPNIRVPFHNPLKGTPGNNDYSTAAGAYQINYPTWLTIQAGAMLPDFTPASQDEAAVWLLSARGAMPYILSGDFANALNAASGTWASLPGSLAQQNPQSYQNALNMYLQNGGIVA